MNEPCLRQVSQCLLLFSSMFHVYAISIALIMFSTALWKWFRRIFQSIKRPIFMLQLNANDQATLNFQFAIKILPTLSQFINAISIVLYEHRLHNNRSSWRWKRAKQRLKRDVRKNIFIRSDNDLALHMSL